MHLRASSKIKFALKFDQLYKLPLHGQCNKIINHIFYKSCQNWMKILHFYNPKIRLFTTLCAPIFSKKLF